MAPPKLPATTVQAATGVGRRGGLKSHRGAHIFRIALFALGLPRKRVRLQPSFPIPGLQFGNPIHTIMCVCMTLPTAGTGFKKQISLSSLYRYRKFNKRILHRYTFPGCNCNQPA